MPELRIQVSPTRFRVPDVTLPDRAQLSEPIITHAPLAVFAILPPEDRLQRQLRKWKDYAAMGIAEIWVVGPRGPAYYRFRDGRLGPAAEFGAPGGVIHFPLAAIAALLK